jgi:hypothetical protein
MTGVRTASLPLLVCVLAALCGTAEARPRFTGHLEPTLTIEAAQNLILEPGEHEAAGSHLRCPEKSRCFAGTLEVGRRTYLPAGGKIRIVLSEKAGRAPLLYANLNRDGSLDTDEESAVRLASSEAGIWDVVMRFPADGAPGGHFAYLFRLMPSDAASRQRMLQVGHTAVVRGHVYIDGRSVLVVLPYDLARDRVELRNGYLGMDCDGDGTIDTSPVSSEYAYADDEEVVFRVGSRYVSAIRADRRQQQLVLQEHPPQDYRRLDLQRGATIPAVTFRRLDGVERGSLVAGTSYTLLFFWGLGCDAWLDDVPTLNEALRRFGSAGFSAVGVSDAADDDAIRSRMKDTGATWMQAAAVDGRPLYLRRFRVWASPTFVLVDGQGLIISRNLEGEAPLRGPGLLKTLELLLPPIGSDGGPGS